MEPNQSAAFKLIEQAQQAMKRGENTAARQFAAQAAQIAPELEEVWLIMAALASPQASVDYLQSALEINPQSERAKKGMLWAQKRLQQELEKQAATDSQAVADAPTVAPVQEKPAAAVTEPVAVVTPAMGKTAPMTTAAVSEPKTSPIPKPDVAPDKPVAVTKMQSEKTLTQRRYSNLLLPVLGIIICLVLSFLALRGVTPVAALINSNVFNGREHGPAWAEVNVIKPTPSQATAGDVTEPTATLPAVTAPDLSLPPTATNAPAVSATPESTNTPFPATSAPTQTSLPTATLTPVLPLLVPSATAELALAEGPSPTPLPTDTAAPVPTPYAAPTARANSGGNSTTAGAAGERWVDVDLTHQMVYAFEGNTVVNSFLVSTGTWQHPTVTGQYNVYIKYQSTRMTGPGYDLPNVPYTMYFYKGYALHGTYWHSNFGTPMSHGCVNLSIPDAQWLYNWASVGTLVNVHY